jgi:hypothetical protein
MVVLHVAVQLKEENDAVTPAGRRLAENETGTALPVTKVAVMPSVTEFPWTTETLGDAADREILDDTGAEVMVSETVVDAEGADPVPVTPMV